MAKSWLQVEQSQEYEALPFQDKVKAKREYWNNVVSTKPNFSTLTQENQQKAKNEFFGGIPYDEEIKIPNVALETVKGTLGTIGKSAVNVPAGIAKGVGTMVSHPIQTAKAVGGTAVGAVQKLIPGEQKQEKYFDSIVQGIQNRYGGRPVFDERVGFEVPAYAKTISEDPFGFLLDVSMIAGATGAGLKTAGKLSKSQALVKAGSFPMTASAVKSAKTAIQSSKPYQTAFPSRTARVNMAIDEGIIKSIRPSVVGKRTSGQSLKYKNNAQEAVKTIVENKNNLQFTDDLGNTVNRLPENLEEFSQAIQQTKSQVYKYYDDLLERAGDQKGTVDLSKISSELDRVVSDKALQIQNPNVIKYAEQLKERLVSTGKLGVKETDDLIKYYNNELQSFYKNPSYDSASKASIDAMVANNLRSSLDKSVSEITGRVFQPIKNKYGALKAIERDVNRRAIVAGRQNAKGLIDFTDIFSAGDVVRGITGFNPSYVAKGLVQSAIKGAFKKINDPNNIVKNMFKTVDKYHAPLAEVVTPEILMDLPINMQKAIMMSERPKQVSYGTKSLPSPKDVPYNPTGQRTPTVKKIITPISQGEGVIVPENRVKRLPYSTIRLGSK